MHDNKAFEEKLKSYMENHGIDAEFLSFDRSCHTVQDAANAVGAEITDFVKNVCLVDSKGSLIVAIVKGEDSASRKRIAKFLGVESVRIATPEEILRLSEYPVGGVPSFGYDATFIIDSKVMEKEEVYTSGGSQKSLVRIAPSELLKANKGTVVRVRR